MVKKNRRMTETTNNNKDLGKEKSKRNDDSKLSITLPSSSSIDKTTKTIENVLILQGGGSLGAFGCGVYKALAKRNIKIDIVAGTSIGAVNAVIIAGAKNGDSPEQSLEQFWLELSDGFVELNAPTSFSYLLSPGFAEQLSRSLDSYYPYSFYGRKNEVENHQAISANEKIRKIKQLKSFYSSAIFGND
ncbi:MAG TPA: patatin-like phospholipase family protein [Nitrososphaera sp.]|nr:patatin-like phospholipase family protein [Nitrososphaera sp.]